MARCDATDWCDMTNEMGCDVIREWERGERTGLNTNTPDPGRDREERASHKREGDDQEGLKAIDGLKDIDDTIILLIVRCL